MERNGDAEHEAPQDLVRGSAMGNRLLEEPRLNGSRQLVVFSLDDWRCALHLGVVDRIERSVEVLPLPKAPDIVLGIVNARGKIIPVFNIRRRFRAREREIGLEDRLILARTRKRTVGFLADSVSGVIERSSEDVITPEQIVPGLEYLEGVTKVEKGLVLIHDLDKFLSLEEERALDAALERL